jgi:four helix bundle protein
MPRLKTVMLDRVDVYADRILDVCLAASKTGTPPFVRDQIARSGTSVGANVNEAAFAMSRPDFRRAIGIAQRELAETGYWLRMLGRRGWIKPARLTALNQETEELLRILAAMHQRTAD